MYVFWTSLLQILLDHHGHNHSNPSAVCVGDSISRVGPPRGCNMLTRKIVGDQSITCYTDASERNAIYSDAVIAFKCLTWLSG